MTPARRPSSACRARVELAAGRSLPCRTRAHRTIDYAGHKIPVCDRHALEYAAGPESAADRWDWPTPRELAERARARHAFHDRAGTGQLEL